MADILTDNQIEELREAFALFDRKGDGTIYLKDLAQLLRSLGQNPTQEETIETVKQLDDGTGVIDFPEFLTLVAKKEKESVENEDDLKEAFRVIDKDGTGSLAKDELEFAMRNLGEGMTDEEVDAMMKTIRFNNDNKITYDELLDTIIHPRAYEKKISKIIKRN